MVGMQDVRPRSPWLRLPPCVVQDVLPALLVAGLAFALYLRTLAPGVLPGDSGELQFGAWLAGFVHPTGYPLYLMLGWLWAHLVPWHDPAWRMNAFSALWGGVTVGLVWLLARRVLSGVKRANQPGGQLTDRLIAFWAALTFALTPTFWSQAVIAEVYTLNAAFVAAVLLGLVTWAQTRRTRVFYLTALAYGLSLAHHRSVVLMAPAGIVYLSLVRRRPREAAGPAHASPDRPTGDTARQPTGQPAGRTLARPRGILLALCLFLPLLLYAYIPLRAPQAPYATVRVASDQMLRLYEPTLQGFLAYVAGQTFRGEIGAPGAAAGRIGTAAQWLVDEMTWVGAVLGLIGAAWLARRNAALLALTSLAWVGVVAFNLFYGIGDIHVFYIPAYLISVLWAAVGLAAVVEGVASRSGGAAGVGPRPIFRAVAVLIPLLALALPAHLLSAHHAQLDRSGDDRARTAWAGILAQPIPEGAILVSNDRDEMMPLWYLQQVERRRTDLLGLFPRIQPAVEWADVGAVADQALRSGRPTYLIKSMPGLEIKFRLEPDGALVRVLGPAASKAPERAATAVYGETLRLLGYDVSPAPLTGGGQVAITLYWQPLAPVGADYTAFVHLLDAEGHKVAQSDHRPGGVYYPSSLWKPGEIVVDRHLLALPAALGRGPHTLVVGLYTGTAELKHLGQPQQVGTVGP